MDAIAVPREKPTFWASLREAIAGSPQDFTRGSLNRAIFLLAVPMVLEMFLESVFAVVDVFWVARLGADALAAVGLSETLLILVYAVALGLSLSATAMVARRVGEKDRDGAATAAVQAIALGVVVGLGFGACGWIFGLALIQTENSDFEMASTVVGGSPRWPGALSRLLKSKHHALSQGRGRRDNRRHSRRHVEDWPEGRGRRIKAFGAVFQPPVKWHGDPICRLEQSI